MVVIGWLAAVVGVAVAAWLAFAAWQRWSIRRAELEIQSARQLFHRRREWLEARFLTLASQSGKPRGLAWVDCEFQDEVAFARDRTTGELRALVGVTIRFKAVDGGGLEDNPNVNNLRAATAVFRMERLTWATDGRAIFNLNPAEAIQHFQHELETVD